MVASAHAQWLNYPTAGVPRLPNGQPFQYHPSQREAIETLIFVWEFEKVRTRKGLLERYAEQGAWPIRNADSETIVKRKAG